MIPYEIDPSLHSVDPAQDSLEDGFSPHPDPAQAAAEQAVASAPPEHPEALLGTKSPF